jgi:hypothetical protein
MLRERRPAMNEERRSSPSIDENDEVKARKRTEELARPKPKAPSRRVPDGVPVIENTDPNAAENQPKSGHKIDPRGI